MNPAIRCPACGTTFEATTEQLALADGWVRCGRCGEVFDGPAHRCERDAPAGAAAAAGASPLPALDMDAFGDALLSFRADAPLPPSGPAAPAPSEPTIHRDADPDAPHDQEDGPAASQPLAPAASAVDPWRDLPSLSLDAGETAPAAASATTAAITATTAPTMAASRTETATPPAGVIQAASEPLAGESVEPATPRRDARRRVRRLLVVGAAIALLLLLIAQVVYRQRDAVAARHPTLRPALAGLCRMAGCSIEPLRRPDNIAIDGATFAQARDSGRYRLDFLLRNQADVPLAMPAIELSLLDTQELPVVRRVLMPADFGVVEPTLSAHGERAGAVSLALDDTASGDAMPRIAGYAMVAFYP